jgi:hypothetical protein
LGRVAAAAVGGKAEIVATSSNEVFRSVGLGFFPAFFYGV